MCCRRYVSRGINKHITLVMSESKHGYRQNNVIFYSILHTRSLRLHTKELLGYRITSVTGDRQGINKYVKIVLGGEESLSVTLLFVPLSSARKVWLSKNSG